MQTPEPTEHSHQSLLEIATQQAQHVRDRVELHQSLRAANSQPERPDEEQLKQLDSSVKRNTGFIKKLRQLSDDNYRSLLDELVRLNQTRYVAEIVSAIADAPLRGRDIEAAIQICSLLHQRYADFGEGVVAALTKSIIARDETKDAAYQQRTRMKLLADLLVSGIYREFAILVETLRQVAGVNFKSDWAESLLTIQLLSSFARHVSDELLGIPSKNIRSFISQTANEPDSGAIKQGQIQQETALQQLRAEYAALSIKLQHYPPVPQAIQQQLLKILLDAHSSATAAFEAYKQSLIRREEQYLRIINSRGDLTEHHASAQEAERSTAEAMQKGVASLADALDKPAPVLPPAVTQQTAVASSVDILSGKEDITAGSGYFEDEETRLFYESLPDLRAVVPGVVLSTNSGDDRADSDIMVHDDPEASDEPEVHLNGDMEQTVDPQEAEAEAAEGSPELEPEPTTPAERQAGQQMLELIKRLGQVRSAKACDDWCLAFCDVNSKASRNRLVRELTDITANKMALLPFYARITATLGQVFSSIADGVVAGLERSFRYYKARKDNDARNVERRAVNARYLAELIKFRCMPFGAFFVLLKSLLDDFVQSNVETAATMVEAAGRLLYSLPETCIRMSNMLEVMQRLKIAKNLNIRQAMLVENAYYICRPPDRPAIEKKERTPLQLYIRHLIHDELAQDDIKQIMRKLRRLPWSENEPYLIRCLLSASVGRYSLAPVLSSLTAGLSRYHPSLRISVVDSLLEEVRAGLEEPHLGTYQRRIGHIVLLGDMYNYKLVDSRIIFDTLHMFLWFGHDNSEEAVILDPPSDFFRTRLICGLLRTCGMFFAKGTAASRLDRFLVYFQRYLLSKEPAPLDITSELQDLLSLLRPNLHRFTTLEEACSAAAALEAQEEGGLEAIEEVPSDEEDGESGSEMGHDGREQSLSQRAGSQIGASDLMQHELDDDTVRLLQPVHAGEVEIDEDFEREFAALVPASAAAVHETAAQDEVENTSRSQTTPAVAFRMLTKRAGRDDRSRAVQVPANAAIVQTLRARASAEADERAQIKRITLAADQRAQLEIGTKPAGPHITKITQPALPDQGAELNALLRPPRQKARSYLSKG